MKHFIILFHIISFFTGISVISFAILAFTRYKNQLIKYYIYFLVAMSILLLEQTISVYTTINLLDSSTVTFLVRLISSISCGLITYIIPLLLYNLVNKELWEKRQSLFKILSLVPFIGLIFYSFLQMRIFLALANIVLFLVILYCLIVFFKNNHKIENVEIRQLATFLVIITAIFFPVMFIDSKIDFIVFLSKFFPFGLLSVSGFYFTWNILNLYCLYKYMNKKNLLLQNIQGDMEEDKYFFFEKYNITPREKEVILLLLKGYTYNQIAEELVISLPTVKTHIRNIYQKAEVKNKIQLLNILSEEKARI